MKRKIDKDKKANIQESVDEQFNISIDLGYFTKEQVEEYKKSKNKKKKQKHNKKKKIKKPIIFLGFNTCKK